MYKHLNSECDFFGASFKGFPRKTIALEMYSMIGGNTQSIYTVKQIENLIDTLYDNYQSVLRSGKYKPFELSNKSTHGIWSYLQNVTGYDKSKIIFPFLRALENLSKSGKIELIHYNPVPVLEVKKQVSDQKKAKINDILSNIVNPANVLLNKFLLVSAIGAGGYLLVKTGAINKVRKSLTKRRKK